MRDAIDRLRTGNIVVSSQLTKTEQLNYVLCYYELLQNCIHVPQTSKQINNILWYYEHFGNFNSVVTRFFKYVISYGVLKTKLSEHYALPSVFSCSAFLGIHVCFISLLVTTLVCFLFHHLRSYFLHTKRYLFYTSVLCILLC